jgi:hypothetical protein
MRRLTMRAVAVATAVVLGVAPMAPVRADPTEPFVCELGKTLQGDYIFLVIDAQGDQHIVVISPDGTMKIYDCPPHDPQG